LDGKKMIVNNRWETYSYTLETPWDISTAAQDGYYDISQDVPFAADPENPVDGEMSTPFTHDLYVMPNGGRIVIDQRPNHLLHQWRMTTPWDITTMEYEGFIDIDFLPANYGRNPETADSKIRGVEFAPSLDRFFVFSPDLKSVAEYKCKEEGSVIDAEIVRSEWIASKLVAQNQSMEFSPDGFRLWITNMSEGELGY